MAWMLDVDRARADDERPGAGAVLRRHGAQQEHAVGADAGVRRLLADHGAVVRLRLQPRVHRGQRVLRRLRPAVPEGHVRLGEGRVRDGRDVLQGVVDARDRVRRVPGDVRGDHRVPDPRRASPSASSSRRCCCSWCSGSRSPTRRSRTWCGSGPARMRTRLPTSSTRPTPRPASSGSGARSTSRAARSCTSTPVSRAWSARTCSASASATARKRCRRTT